MSTSTPRANFPSEELWRLVGALCDSTLTEPERDRLEDLLRTDREAKRFAATYLDQHARLLWRYRETNGREQQATLKQRSPLIGSVSRMLHSATNSWLAATLLVAAAIYGIFGYLAWDLRSKHPSGEIQHPDTAVAIVNRAADVQWSPGAASKSDNASIRLGEPLKIESGTMELELNTGTKLVVEGPADWSVDGNNSVSLRVGKLTAHVPPQAIGFTVETPTAIIVDLGTEFAVEAGERGATEVQVLKGKIELHPHVKHRDSPSVPSPITLTAGSARRIELNDRDGQMIVREITPTADRFVRSSVAPDIRPITVQGVVASSTHPLLNVYDLINGSGLKGGRHSAAWQSTMWHTAHERVKHEFVLFDLFRPRRLDSMKVWNFNDASNGRSAWTGVKQADIYVSTSGKGDPLSQPGEWKLVVADQQFAPGTGLPDYDTPTIVALNDVEGRFVAIVIEDAWGYGPHPTDPSPDVVGLSEVQFFGTRLDFQKPQSAPKKN